MGLEIPAEVQWLSWIVGSDWPEGDETAMRRCAEAWHQAAGDINELIPDLQNSASNVLGSVQGAAADSFEQYWEKFVATDPQYIPKLVELCENLAKQVEQGALDIEYAKYMFIALLIITAIEIAMLIASMWATFGASSAAIPAVEAAAQVTARTIFQRLLIAIAKGAAIGALQGVGLDVLIQGIQIAKGDRDGLDLKKTALAGMDGAIGGAISGGVGHGLGHVPGLGGAADGAAGNMVRGAARQGLAEGISGVAGTAATAAIHGDPITLESLAKGGTSGAFGGSAGGARDGLNDTNIGGTGTAGTDGGPGSPQIDPVPDFTSSSDGGTPDGGSSGGGSSSHTGGGSSGGSTTTASYSDGGASSASSSGGSSTYTGGGSHNQVATALGGDSQSSGGAPSHTNLAGTTAAHGNVGSGSGSGVGGSGGVGSAPVGGGQSFSGGGGADSGSPGGSDGGSGRGGSSGGASGGAPGGVAYGGPPPGAGSGSPGGSPTGGAVPPGAMGGQPGGAPRTQVPPATSADGTPDSGVPRSFGSASTTTDAPADRPLSSAIGEDGSAAPHHQTAGQATTAGPTPDGRRPDGESSGASHATDDPAARTPTAPDGGGQHAPQPDSGSATPRTTDPAAAQSTPHPDASAPDASAPDGSGPGTETAEQQDGSSSSAEESQGEDAAPESDGSAAGGAAGPAVFMPMGVPPMGAPGMGAPGMGAPGMGAGPPSHAGGSTGGAGARLRFDSPDAPQPVEPLISSSVDEPEAPDGDRSADPAASDDPAAPDGTRPGDADAIPPGLPDHLRDVYGASEETPAGRSLYGPDEQNMRDLARRVQADPNQYVLDGHGTPDGMRAGDQALNVQDVADIIRNDPNWNGREVLLLSCDTGREGAAFAAGLASELGVPVVAPDGLAWSDNQGRVFSSSSAGEPGPDGSRSPTWPPDGGWNTFQPDGSSAPVGERGFAPGRPDDTATTVATPPEHAEARGDGDGHGARDPSERDDTGPPADRDIAQPGDAAQDAPRAGPSLHPDSPFARPFDLPPDLPVVRATADPDVPFSLRNDLQPNTRYEVEGRGTFWTDGDGRVTHVDAVTPNTANGHNPDVRFPQPNTNYRVQTEYGALSYRTDHLGYPPRAAVFEPPENRPHYTIGGTDPAVPTPPRDGVTLPEPPAPGEGFAHRDGLPPNAEIRVHDSSGNYVGTYHTDGDGAVSHLSVDSGRQYRAHPELGTNHRDGVQYRLSPDFDINNPRPESPGFRPPPTDGEVRVVLDQPSATRAALGDPSAAGQLGESNLSRRPSAADSFADRRLEPNRRYVAEVVRDQRIGPEPYGIFYTDGSGNVVAVDTFKPFNPDLTGPPANAQIQVENGPTVINTREPVDVPAPASRDPERTRPYVGPHGLSHEPSYDRPDNRLRRDSTAQSNVGGVGRAEYPQELWAGGHAARNFEGLGGEESHQVPQLDSQNSGRNLPPKDKPQSWYDMENARVERAQSGIEIGPINLVTANQPGLGTPSVMWQVWTETPPGGRPEIWIRSFPNVPAAVPSGR